MAHIQYWYSEKIQCILNNGKLTLKDMNNTYLSLIKEVNNITNIFGINIPIILDNKGYLYIYNVRRNTFEVLHERVKSIINPNRSSSFDLYYIIDEDNYLYQIYTSYNNFSMKFIGIFENTKFIYGKSRILTIDNKGKAILKSENNIVLSKNIDPDYLDIYLENDLVLLSYKNKILALSYKDEQVVSKDKHIEIDSIKIMVSKYRNYILQLNINNMLNILDAKDFKIIKSLDSIVDIYYSTFGNEFELFCVDINKNTYIFNERLPSFEKLAIL